MIPKPEIPPDIAHNYKQVKVQWTEQLVATQQQKTEAIKKETQHLKVILLLLCFSSASSSHENIRKGGDISNYVEERITTSYVYQMEF